jgi:aspartyl/asparaginyl beta-hydroxylase (cupin superfamily)
MKIPFDEEIKYDNVDLKLDGTGMLMGYSQGVPIENTTIGVRTLLGMKIKYAMVNVLPPGIVIPVHTDYVYGERNLRVHYVVKTNPRCEFWDSSGWRHQEKGYLHVVKYWEPHAVRNLGYEERIHLVFDLEVEDDFLKRKEISGEWNI